MTHHEAAMANRIACWLGREAVLGADSGLDGAVVTWREPDGVWNAGYPEIAGYYLTFAAWRPTEAGLQAPRVVDWLGRIAAHGAPPTRVYPGAVASDWRNDYLFSFDLAMAARGLAAAALRLGCGRADAEARYTDLIVELAEPDGVLRPGRPRILDGPPPPDRWSTRPGAHHAKAAAGLMAVADSRLAMIGDATLRRWGPALADAIRQGRSLHAHAALYGVEGFLLEWGRTGDARWLATALGGFRAALDLGLGGGDEDARARAADVTAQIIRAGLVLEAAGALEPAAWAARRAALMARLRAHVRDDGAVLFDLNGRHRNSWAAMFACQALAFAAAGRRLDARQAAAAIV